MTHSSSALVVDGVRWNGALDWVFPDENADPEARTSWDVFRDFVDLWAEIAVRHAHSRDVTDPDGVTATVAGIDGPRGFGTSNSEALDDLRSALTGWALRKLEEGDDDIPSMEGLHLGIPR